MEDTHNDKLLPIGYTFEYDGYKYHVVAIVKDEHGNRDEVLYILKYYGKRKQWWHYEVWEEIVYKLREESNMLKHYERKR